MEKRVGRIEFLKQKYVGSKITYEKDYVRLPGDENEITEKAFNAILNADPSHNKQYIFWLLNIYSKGCLKLEDLFKAKEYLEYFYKYKSKIKEELRNIADYKDLHHLYQEVEFLMNMDEQELMSHSEIIKKTKEEGVDVIYEDGRWKIVVPLNQDTSNLYGKDTQWCTTSSKGGYFDRYTQRDFPNSKLYIIIDKLCKDKERKRHKYQFHYESRQFKDATNGNVDLNAFFIEHKKILDILSSLDDSFGMYLRMRYGLKSRKEITVIEGDLDFSRLDIQVASVEEKIHVKGNCYISSTSVRKIKHLHVDGDLVMSNSNLEHIVDYLYVGGNLYAEGSELKSLPDNTVIKSVAKMNCCKLSSIPKNMEVGYNLYLVDTLVNEIPAECKLKVGVNLYTHGLGIPTEEIKLEYIGGRIYNNATINVKF